MNLDSVATTTAVRPVADTAPQPPRDLLSLTVADRLPPGQGVPDRAGCLHLHRQQMVPGSDLHRHRRHGTPDTAGWEPGVLWSWNYQVTGAGSGRAHDRTRPEFLLIWLSGVFGFDETVAQWLFYSIIYGLVAFGVACAAGAIVRSEWASSWQGPSR